MSDINAFIARFTAGAFFSRRRELLGNVARRARPTAQAETPVLSGFLQASEREEVRSETEAAVETDVRYGPFVHEREPFFQRAAELSVDDAEDELQRFGDQVVADWAG